MLRSFFPAPAFEAPNDGGNKPWYEGKADEATVGYFTARGWGGDAVTAAIEASKAHREAEKKLGIPSNEVVRFPTKQDDPAWAQVWERLGVGKTAAEYDLSNVKVNGKALDPALATTLQTLAHTLNLPKDRAPILAAEIAKLDVSRATAADAAKVAKIQEERGALVKDWGNHFEANKMVASNAAARFGITPEEINALEGTVGYARTMMFLRDVGMRMGEDKFIRNDQKPGGGTMSVPEAKAQIETLKADRDWVNRYRNGGAAEAKQFSDLTKIIAGVS